jgi:5-deoxy-glucuronate isomerase
MREIRGSVPSSSRPTRDECTVHPDRPATRGRAQLPRKGGMFASETDREEAFRALRAPNASGAGGRFALAGAKCERQLPARYGPAPEVPAPRAGHMLHRHSEGHR